MKSVIPRFMAQGGDFINANGTGAFINRSLRLGSYSIYGRQFEDESFSIPHNKAGLLSMVYNVIIVL